MQATMAKAATAAALAAVAMGTTAAVALFFYERQVNPSVSRAERILLEAFLSVIV